MGTKKPVLHRALIAKSREAALTAVQTYNNPLIKFKSETFIMLMTVAWTYLLHAHFGHLGVDYRYEDKDSNSKRKFQRSPDGGYRWWDLSMCLSRPQSPLDKATAANLRFLLGLRHQIEHHRPPHLDDEMSGRYLACAMNYEYWLTAMFGEQFSLGETVAIALQFRDLVPTSSAVKAKLPGKLASYISDFDASLSEEERDDPRYSVRLTFMQKVVNKAGQSDRAIEFLRPDDPKAAGLSPEAVVVRETERPKYRAKAVVQRARNAGFGSFGMHQHTLLWKQLDAKNPTRGYGVEVANEWFWYDRWIEEVLGHCEKTYGKPRAITKSRKGRPASNSGQLAKAGSPSRPGIASSSSERGSPSKVSTPA